MYEARLRRFFRAAHFPVLEYGPPHFIVTPQIIATLREVTYLEQWQLARRNKWFHVCTEDHSLFIFSEAGNASHSFLHAPLELQSMREYLGSRGLPYDTRTVQEHRDAYDLIFETAELRTHILPIRYDCDPVAYEEGVHPHAHLHFGLENNVRLGMQRLLTPEAFVLFVMRQMYPQCWRRLVERRDELYMSRAIRESLDLVPAANWTAVDQLENYLA